MIFGTGAALLLAAGSALADDATSKPQIGNGPAVEKSVPSSAPAATTTQTTGATNQDKTVKSMNNNEKAKIEANGK
nr:hypothetical protein [uncultured Rhodopila sp.]